MNSLQNGEFDITGKYISPEKIEKAPEGFTERVMIQVGMENIPVSSRKRFSINLIVPAAAFLTAVVLIAVAGFTNPSSESLFLNSVSHLLTKIGAFLPDMKIDKLQEFTLPGVVFYIVIGIFILTLFDLALNRFFHHRDREGLGS